MKQRESGQPLFCVALNLFQSLVKLELGVGRVNGFGDNPSDMGCGMKDWVWVPTLS